MTFENRFDGMWAAVCRVEAATRQQIDWMIGRHYLHKWPAVVVMRLILYHRETDVGCIVFALPPRETGVRYGGTTWELARLWVDDCMPPNTESWFLARAVAHVRRHRPEVQYLVSYADPSVGHSGTIYRAANWTTDGRTDEGRKTPRSNYVDPTTGKCYGRRSHVPAGVVAIRIPRVSKARFMLRCAKDGGG